MPVLPSVLLSVLSEHEIAADKGFHVNVTSHYL